VCSVHLYGAGAGLEDTENVAVVCNAQCFVFQGIGLRLYCIGPVLCVQLGLQQFNTGCVNEQTSVSRVLNGTAHRRTHTACLAAVGDLCNSRSPAAMHNKVEQTDILLNPVPICLCLTYHAPAAVFKCCRTSRKIMQIVKIGPPVFCTAHPFTNPQILCFTIPFNRQDISKSASCSGGICTPHVIQYWSHPTQHSVLHLGRFSRFRTAHGRDSVILYNVR